MFSHIQFVRQLFFLTINATISRRIRLMLQDYTTPPNITDLTLHTTSKGQNRRNRQMSPTGHEELYHLTSPTHYKQAGAHCHRDSTHQQQKLHHLFGLACKHPALYKKLTTGTHQ